MHVLICDDELYYACAIRSSIERWKALSGNSNIAVESFRSSEDVLAMLQRKHIYDLAFLDIQFPGEISGLQLAQALREINNQVIVVFVSNYEEYATDGYRVNALRFFYKPISDHQIFECMDIAYRQWQMCMLDAPIIVESRQTLHKISSKAILYIESVAPYLNICVLSPEKGTVRIRKKLNDMYSLLPRELFVQCHQSFIVNLLHVQQISKSNMVMTDGTQIPISARFKDQIYLRFKAAYLGDGK